MFRVVSIKGQEWLFDSKMEALQFKAMNNILGYVQPVNVETTCKRCEWDNHVPHNNCLYGGRRIGHSVAHCTADACY